MTLEAPPLALSISWLSGERPTRRGNANCRAFVGGPSGLHNRL